MGDVDLFEVNEAFASMMVYCVDKLNLPMDRLNVNGGAMCVDQHPGMENFPGFTDFPTPFQCAWASSRLHRCTADRYWAVRTQEARREHPRHQYVYVSPYTNRLLVFRLVSSCL